MNMFILFFCLCPLSLTIKLNPNISKAVYWQLVSTELSVFRLDWPVPKVGCDALLSIDVEQQKPKQKVDRSGCFCKISNWYS